MLKINRLALNLSLFIALLSFSGCFNLFGSENTSEMDPKSELFENEQFSIAVPKDWQVITKKDFTAEVPKETVVVFRNNVKNETFTANINVVKNSLQETMPSLEYAKLVHNRQQSGLVDYKEIRNEETKIKVGEKEDDTFFTIFEARKKTNEILVRYLQTYAVKEKDTYIITGAVSTKEDENTIQIIENIVKSFRLK